MWKVLKWNADVDGERVAEESRERSAVTRLDVVQAFWNPDGFPAS